MTTRSHTPSAPQPKRTDRVDDIAALRQEFAARQAAIRQRLRDFAAVPRDQYYYELVYCLLTPQSSAEHAGRVVHLLQEADHRGIVLPLPVLLSHREHYIRFHNTKSRHILLARSAMPVILDAIDHAVDGQVLREWLVGHVKGLGWKEASHFLRNIGWTNLAILDRHILRNLRRYRVIRSIPASLTRIRYLAIEGKFQAFTRKAGISMDELDLLFWSRETGVILK